MDVVTFVFLASILPFLLLRLHSWLFSSPDYWTSRGIPCLPGRRPIFGHTWSILTLQENISMFCARIYKSYPNQSMIGFYKFSHPVLLLREPELARTILQTNFSHFHDNESTMDPQVDPMFARDLLFQRGTAWKNSRAVFVSPLTPKRLREMTPVVANVCEKLKKYLTDQMATDEFLELEGKSLYSRYTTEVAAGVVFGLDGNSFAKDHEETFLGCMKSTLEPTKIKALRHHTAFFLPPTSFLKSIVKPRFVPLSVDRFFRKVVEELDDLRSTGATSAGNDVLQVMLDTEKRGRIHRADTLAHTFSFFMESFETSSLTLGYASYWLARYPHVQDRLRLEVDSVIAKHEGRLTYDAVGELNYLDQVLNETFRFLPVVGAVSKCCTQEFRLEGSDGLAVNVEPGTTIVVPIWAFHRDPNIWENAEEFRPERFDKSEEGSGEKIAHLPFSTGPRSCPGQRLAILQVKMAIAAVVRNFRLEMSPKMPEELKLDPKHFLTAPSGGFWIRLRRLEKITD